jgi:hypothetical protein
MTKRLDHGSTVFEAFFGGGHLFGDLAKYDGRATSFAQ